ncbi:hypothetical protein MIT9_P0801 [Methylomarinovum caldicuralii]|uniref:Metal-binding protein n=1 Tax=Methylomarinovum caldicuralii TaxID=438856 RepID=A0AAU9C0Y5_9GAMM|nr:metal-binding protein [Methylomarinovum caldicuralii]BCX81223.1 hypothetical protein MIT9_P0801 [Methylomarinovum caldicuralii]
MSEEKPSCDLCSLLVEIPDFELKTKDGVKRFCCEGCLGIYRMLHEDEIVEDPQTAEEKTK